MDIIIKCPACDARNKISEDQPPAKRKPVCGRCHTPLVISQATAPVNLTDTTFDTFILKSHKPVLVDFWANWCAPCRMMDPILEIFTRSQHSIVVAKVDTDRNPLTTSRFRVFSIPTLILLEGGDERKRITGAVSLRELEKQLKQWIRFN